MRRLLNLIFTLCTALLSGCAGIPFHPSSDVDKTPEDVGLLYEDVRISTSDGETLAGWFIPAPQGGHGPGAHRVLLFFHGNAGNISHRLESLLIFHNLGLSQLIIDYRGFGKSSGKPSVEGVKLDAIAAWEWLLQQKDYAPRQVVLFGRSLGGAVAASLGGKAGAGGIILESTFTSLVDVAKGMYPMLPVSLLLPQDFDSLTSLAGVHVPLLVIHSPDDEVIDFSLGRALYETYKGPKRFLEIRGSHNSGFLESSSVYVRGLAEFLSELDQEREHR